MVPIVEQLLNYGTLVEELLILKFINQLLIKMVKT